MPNPPVAPVVAPDPFLLQAARCVVGHALGSAELLERNLPIDLAQATRLLQQLQSVGIVGPPNGDTYPVLVHGMEAARMIDAVVKPRSTGDPTPRAVPTPNAASPSPWPAPVTAPATPARSLDAILADLDAMIGLTQLKGEVRSLTNLLKVRAMRVTAGLPSSPVSLHAVFSGNPGTGKTTVARLLAEIYQALGLLSSGHLIETDRSGLVAGYAGQTAIKVHEVVDSAVGGVLFIDEAYSLSGEGPGDDYGHEAIDTLVKLMEDKRDVLAVVVAGYEDRMTDFLNANPGLQSRFNRFLHFADYTPAELTAIFAKLAAKGQYALTDEATAAVQATLTARYTARDERFGNAREARNLYERLVERQADRLASVAAPTREQLCTIEKVDVDAATPGAGSG
jgi:ATPase family protein associated with various cellular activities (AAA)/AAA lid domain-containing protein